MHSPVITYVKTTIQKIEVFAENGVYIENYLVETVNGKDSEIRSKRFNRLPYLFVFIL